MGGSGRSRSTIIILALASITLLTLDFQGVAVVDTVRDGARTVFGPVESAADAVIDPFRDAWNGAFDYDELTAENERLRSQLEEVAGNEVELEELTARYEALQEQAQLKPPGGYTSVTGRVVSRASSNFDRTIEIDIGSADGAGKGMPVVTGSGLAGKIHRVSSDRSVVLLANDIAFEVGVRMVGSGDVGLAHGSGEGNPLIVDAALEPETEIEPGENVVTSGLEGSQYPPGVAVGKVTAVERDERGIPTVEVDLIAELSRLSFVSVLIPDEAG